MPSLLSKANIPTALGFDMDNHYRRPEHIKFIERKIREMIAGKFHKLLVTMPPRHGKSELLSKYFPAWLLLQKDSSKIILTSYQSSFAAEWGLKVRNILREFKLINPHRSASNSFLTTNGGSFHTAGVDGAITGKGANWLIIDDPIKNDKAAFSAVQRESVWNFYLATATTRLEPDGKIIVIQTRWHHDDLAGRILASENDWEIINIPAIAKQNDILNREEGQALWPERFPIEKLLEIKRTIGQYWFSALYQQEPISSQYQIFKPENWQFYYERPKCSYIIQTWDTAFKTGEANDYSVCATWGVSDGKCYLLDLWRNKCTFLDLLQQVVLQFNIWKPAKVLIEDAASGQDLIPTLKKNTHIPIKAVPPMAKEIRAHIVSPLVDQGIVYIPYEAIWLSDFINEHSQFPAGKNDDIVDTSTISLQELSKVILSQTSNNGSADSPRPERRRKESINLL
jgi:predicted phage terminase large subunit-like protein